MAADDERQLAEFYRDLFTGTPDAEIERVVNAIAGDVRSMTANWEDFVDILPGMAMDRAREIADKFAKRMKPLKWRLYRHMFAKEPDSFVESVVTEITSRVRAYDRYRERWPDVNWKEAQQNIQTARRLSESSLVVRPWWFANYPPERIERIKTRIEPRPT